MLKIENPNKHALPYEPKPDDIRVEKLEETS